MSDSDFKLPPKALEAATIIYFQQRFGASYNNYKHDPEIQNRYKNQTSLILEAFMKNLD